MPKMLALIALLALLTTACNETSGGRVVIPEQIDRIVLITIDTLRADHLSSYGYPRKTSPFLDSLADRGVLFGNAYSHSGTTQPSHASIFTSLYPIQHQVLRNGHVLDQEIVTLAEHFANHGYATAGFTSTNAHFYVSGLARGYAVYDEFMEKRTAEKAKKYRNAKDTVDQAIGWIDRRQADEKFFLWVHLFDPHRPFQPPSSYLQEIERQTQTESIDMATHLEKIHNLDSRTNPKLRGRIDKYDAEILYADSQLQRLFEAYQNQKLDHKSIWVVTSDHGQGLMNHQYFGHSRYLYQEQTHIPLIFFFSDRNGPPVRIEERIVEHVDIAPTLTELAGIPALAQLDAVQGQSLVALMTGEFRLYKKRYSFAQRGEYDFESEKKTARFKRGKAYTLQDGESKYLYFPKARDEFYDLQKDPFELENRVHERNARSLRMKKALREMIVSLRNSRNIQQVDPETFERLKALGYTQ